MIGSPLTLLTVMPDVGFAPCLLASASSGSGVPCGSAVSPVSFVASTVPAYD